MNAVMTANVPGGIDALLSLGGNAPATNRLAASAMLVDLTIRQWSGVKNEPRITREVAAQHGSDAAMGKYQKYLLGRAALKSIQEHCTETYQEHRRRTLPWLDGGQRILSSAGYFEYTSYMRKRIDDFNDLVADFLANYTGYIRDAEARLGPQLFNPSDYPSLGEIRGKFEVATRVYPLPTAGDFRAELGDAEVARVRREIEGTAQEAFRGAVQDVSGRITATVGKMVSKLAGYTGGREGAFRDSLVENVRELVEILPALNITGETWLDEITERMRRELCSTDADVLRVDEGSRTRVLEAAESILSDMAGFVA